MIADEPTTAIDAITQYEILEEFERIKREKKTAMIFITHDLGAISKVADRIMVMNSGRIVEQGISPYSMHMPKILIPDYWDRKAYGSDGSLPGYPETGGEKTMLELKNICVSFRSERQEKIFALRGHRFYLMYACLCRREPVWESWESREVENRH